MVKGKDIWNDTDVSVNVLYHVNCKTKYIHIHFFKQYRSTTVNIVKDGVGHRLTIVIITKWSKCITEQTHVSMPSLCNVLSIQTYMPAMNLHVVIYCDLSQKDTVGDL